MDTNKAIPTRDPLTIALEQEIIKYNKEGDHCSGNSPVLDPGCTYYHI